MTPCSTVLTISSKIRENTASTPSPDDDDDDGCMMDAQAGSGPYHSNTRSQSSGIPETLPTGAPRPRIQIAPGDRSTSHHVISFPQYASPANLVAAHKIENLRCRLIGGHLETLSVSFFTNSSTRIIMKARNHCFLTFCAISEIQRSRSANEAGFVTSKTSMAH